MFTFAKNSYDLVVLVRSVRLVATVYSVISSSASLRSSINLSNIKAASLYSTLLNVPLDMS